MALSEESNYTPYYTGTRGSSGYTDILCYWQRLLYGTVNEASDSRLFASRLPCRNARLDLRKTHCMDARLPVD